jgi:quercetin dioxygenase-like cupin family protein
MTDDKKNWQGIPFPEMIQGLPEVDVSLKGIRGWLLQSEDKQVVFFDIEPVGEMPAHSHCGQWGIVVAGKMSLTIGDKTKVYQKGDWYYIPEGVVHSATFLTRVNAIDIFDHPQRYKVKEHKASKSR